MSRDIVNRSSGIEIVNGQRLYGLDAEVHKKMEAKRDPQLEITIGSWIIDVTKEKLEYPDDIIESLRSGIILCKLVNTIQPGTIPRYNTRRIPLLEMENIGLYLKGVWQLGVPSAELFVTSDLYRRKGVAQVFINLLSLARLSRTISTFKGPHIPGVAEVAEKRETKWTGAIGRKNVLYISDIEAEEERRKNMKVK